MTKGAATPQTDIKKKGDSELSPGQKARQAATSKIVEDQKRIIAAHKAHAAELRESGKEKEAKEADEVVSHYTRLMKEAEKVRDNPAPDPKMSIDLNTPEGKMFARSKGFLV